MTEPHLTRRAAREAAGKASESRGPSSRFRYRTALMGVAIGATFLLLGTGAVYAGFAVGTTRVPTPPPITAVPEEPRAVPTELPAASDLRTCSVKALAADDRLKDFYASVVDAETGQELYSNRGDTPERTGSVLKVLTASAALAVLGPDYRLTTRVVDGDEEGSVVLVGGGDPTLSRLSEGQNSVYGDAPKLDDLAQQTVDAYEDAHPGEEISEVVLDASYWPQADRWHPTWNPDQITKGQLSEVVALQVDGDRNNPQAAASPRSNNPVGRAGEAFVEALEDAGASDVSMREGTAAGGARELAAVSSKTVKSLIKQMLLESENTIAEALARVVSKESGLDGSTASLDQAIPDALEEYGLDTSELTIIDGSGLSRDNRVPGQFIAKLMIQVAEQANGLNYVYDGLPVGGESGTLSARFTGNNPLKGNVHAKTGWIRTAYALGGFMDAADGARLTFFFVAVGDEISSAAKTAIDNLAAGVYECGSNLSAN